MGWGAKGGGALTKASARRQAGQPRKSGAPAAWSVSRPEVPAGVLCPSGRVLCSPGWSLPPPLLVVVNPRLPGQTLGGPPRSFRSKAALTLGAEVKHVRPGHTLKGPCCHLGSGLAEPSLHKPRSRNPSHEGAWRKPESRAGHLRQSEYENREPATR